jgi:Matrixin
MRRAHLALDTLERRDVPATFGIPWPNGTAITVSFAPDGADVDGSANELSALMARNGLSEAVWQKEILRAFQNWVSQADLNIGRVGDDGSSLGVPGFEQADRRFGDIRIFAVPLSSSVLAITTPPGDLAGTRTGDIIINSNYNFGVGPWAQRDLYTVMLQEAGHALGVGNSPNSSSAMYEFYQGTRSGLSSEDVGKIQALYKARPPRTWEPATGNNTSATATPLAGTGDRLTYGDVVSSSDPDWYSFTAAADGPATVRVEVAGLSLLAGRVKIFDAWLNLLGSTTAGCPGQDLTQSVTLHAGDTYYVRVEDAPGTAFTAGQYRLRIDTTSQAPETITLAGQSPEDDAGTNETFLSATRLNNVSTSGGAEYRIFARLQPSDTDVYRVRSPFPGMNQSNVLTATVRAFGDIAPEVTVSNALGLPVASRLISDGNGLYTVVADGAGANIDYNIAVRSRTGAAGDYEFRATFRSQVTSAHQVDSGLLTLLNPRKTGTLEVHGSAQIYFRLSAALTPVVGPSITLRVYDSLNQVKFQLLAKAGDRVDGVALLSTGRYRVEVVANGLLFLPAVLAGFTLETALLTDPVGVTPNDPNDPGGGDPPPPPPADYGYYDENGYYVWGETTPSGNP